MNGIGNHLSFAGIVRVQGSKFTNLPKIHETIGKGNYEVLAAKPSEPHDVFARMHDIYVATDSEKSTLKEFKSKNGINQPLSECTPDQQRAFAGIFGDVTNVGQDTEKAIEILQK